LILDTVLKSNFLVSKLAQVNLNAFPHELIVIEHCTNRLWMIELFKIFNMQLIFCEGIFLHILNEICPSFVTLLRNSLSYFVMLCNLILSLIFFLDFDFALLLLLIIYSKFKFFIQFDWVNILFAQMVFPFSFVNT